MTSLTIMQDTTTAVKGYLETLDLCTRNKTADKIIGVLEKLMSTFDKNFYSRTFDVRNEAYDKIINVLTSFKEEDKIVCSALKLMIRLTSCQSNLLNEKGIGCQIESNITLKNTQLILRWVKQCCLRSEKNRQDVFDAGVMDVLINILGDEFIRGSKVRDVCSLLRALTLDDDPELDYGNSVGRTCDIANDTLAQMTILLRRFKNEKNVIGEILQTLSVLSVRKEHCKIVEDAGGIDSVLEVMSSFRDDEKLNCLILRLIKTLSGNDDVKVHLVTRGAAPLIVSAMYRIQTGAISVAGLSCMAALTLGSPRNSGIFYDCKTPALIIETMKRYPGNITVQRYGIRTVSNMTAINKVESRVFEVYDIESVLEMAMKIHGDPIDEDLKSAFKNLGLNPDLKDHWTK